MDCIEDAPSQQDQEEGVDEDEDEQPRKRTRRATDTRRMVNKGKGKARVKGENVEQNDDEEEDGGEDGRDKIDVANFCDQSLTKADATRLTGLSQDWERMRETLHASAYQTLNDIARVVAEVTEDEKVFFFTQELSDVNLSMKTSQRRS